MFLQNAGIHLQDYKVSYANEHSLNSHHCDNLKLKNIYTLFATTCNIKNEWLQFVCKYASTHVSANTELLLTIHIFFNNRSPMCSKFFTHYNFEKKLYTIR
jgi:hypothetical protein